MKYIVKGLLVSLLVLAAATCCRGEPTIDELRSKAQRGDGEAQILLGISYMDGKGVPEDVQEAVKWFRKAAEQGIPEAQLLLGLTYWEGRGVPKDTREGAAWIRKAAEQGQARAQLMMGLYCAGGNGVPQDYVQAHMWLLLAYRNGEPASSYISDIAAQMSSEQINEAKRLAGEWKPRR